MIISGAKSLVSNKHLITKMKFPISTIPTFTNLTALYSHFILVALIFMFYIIFKVPFTIYIVQLPIYMLLTFVFLNLWSFFVSSLIVFSKDLMHLIRSFMTALFWLSGVIFNVGNISIPAIKIFLSINPVTFLVNGYRNCFITQRWIFQDLKELGAFCIILIILGILGLYSYRKLRKEIPDVL